MLDAHYNERKVTSFKYSMGWLLALIFPITVACWEWIFGAGFGDIAINARIFLAIFGSAICMWIFDVVPSFVPGLFIILSSVTLGIVPHKIILSGFSGISFIMALSFLGLGSAIMASALPDRLYKFLERIAPKSQIWRMSSLMVVGSFMTMTIPTVPGTGVRFDMLKGMLRHFKLHNPRERFLAVLQIFQGAQLFSPVFLSGSTLNFILLSLLRAQEQFRFQWLGWVQAMMVFMAVILVGHTLLSWIVSRFISAKASPNKKFNIHLEAGNNAKLRLHDWIALVCFVIFCVGLLTSELHKIYPAWLALLTLYVLLLYSVLQQDDFRHKIPWESMILLASLSGTLAGLEYMHLNAELGKSLQWLGGYMAVDFTTFFFILVGIVWSARFLVPFGITAIILSAIFVPLSYQHGVNPWCVSITIMVLAQCWFFPYQSAEFQNLRNEFGKEQDKYFLIYNACMNIIRVIALFVSFLYWGRLGFL
ncbi:MAG: anion permease [Alphaproteobacteria bacterium]|nr:anion permease [Alphaproteobacteria bacterium]